MRLLLASLGVLLSPSFDSVAAYCRFVWYLFAVAFL